MLAEVTAMSWPEAILGIVVAICVASYMLGKWPWERDIYHTCDCDKEDEED